MVEKLLMSFFIGLALQMLWPFADEEATDKHGCVLTQGDFS